MIVAAVDPVDWRLELERVGPRLKGEATKLVPDGGGWRSRVESLGGFVESYKRHGLTVDAVGKGKGEGEGEGGVLKGAIPHVPAAPSPGAGMGAAAATGTTCIDIRTAGAGFADECERVSRGESRINSAAAFEQLCAAFRDAKADAEARERRSVAQRTVVNERTATLAETSEQLDELKDEVERKSNAAGDTDPVVNIRAALAALREETTHLELRLGIVHQQLGRRQVTRADRARKKSARSRASTDSRGTGGGASTAASNEALAESLSDGDSMGLLSL
eukprot:CAMPEP_0205908788 /NCGR_PEP_ID=MMETSP1325-20131115/3445_1 /ASSEMBLY_ACC=CAM_ASM_000708 /TAXON_ID=236786 /ORGANISM="Florenciella sp., Strain RCC1007" /LENGTH=276 /DNA_ID=CAMNT_0053275027 /DNA_START=35 /DNA_END=865 /DNA_ORIENTATION=-